MASQISARVSSHSRGVSTPRKMTKPNRRKNDSASEAEDGDQEERRGEAGDEASVPREEERFFTEHPEQRSEGRSSCLSGVLAVLVVLGLGLGLCGARGEVRRVRDVEREDVAFRVQGRGIGGGILGGGGRRRRRAVPMLTRAGGSAEVASRRRRSVLVHRAALLAPARGARWDGRAEGLLERRERRVRGAEPVRGRPGRAGASTTASCPAKVVAASPPLPGPRRGRRRAERREHPGARGRRLERARHGGRASEPWRATRERARRTPTSARVDAVVLVATAPGGTGSARLALARRAGWGRRGRGSDSSRRRSAGAPRNSARGGRRSSAAPGRRAAAPETPRPARDGPPPAAASSLDGIRRRRVAAGSPRTRPRKRRAPTPRPRARLAASPPLPPRPSRPLPLPPPAPSLGLGGVPTVSPRTPEALPPFVPRTMRHVHVACLTGGASRARGAERVGAGATSGSARPPPRPRAARWSPPASPRSRRRRAAAAVLVAGVAARDGRDARDPVPRGVARACRRAPERYGPRSFVAARPRRRRRRRDRSARRPQAVARVAPEGAGGGRRDGATRGGGFESSSDATKEPSARERARALAARPLGAPRRFAASPPTASTRRLHVEFFARVLNWTPPWWTLAAPRGGFGAIAGRTSRTLVAGVACVGAVGSRCTWLSGYGMDWATPSRFCSARGGVRDARAEGGCGGVFC